MPGFRLKIVLAISIPLLAVLLGCSSVRPPPPEDPSAERLRKIGLAYLQLANAGHPPHDAEALKNALKQTGESDVDSLFVSPADQRPFVIIWGVDTRQLGAPTSTPIVLAYEEVGKDGVRHAVTAQCFVARLGAEEFSKATFPRGHVPKR